MSSRRFLAKARTLEAMNKPDTDHMEKLRESAHQMAARAQKMTADARKVLKKAQDDYKSAKLKPSRLP